MTWARSLVGVALLVGCSYPEFAFQSDAEAVDDAVDTSVIDSAGDTLFPSEDTTAIDSSVAETVSADTATDSAADTALEAEAATPECKANTDCACGTICVTGKCVASDCTKDNHFCPAGKTCTCVGGRWQLSGSTLAADSGIIEAKPIKASEDGVDLVLRNYDLRNAASGVHALLIAPANCTSNWYYRNVVIQCVDTNDSAGGGIFLSRRGDPVTCRPTSPPSLLVDRVNVGMSGSLYNGFTDLEYKTVHLRKVTSNTGLLFDTWGPGEIGELIIEGSPDLAAELQGKIKKVTVIASPGLAWWGTSPTEDRSTWPKIPIFYDKASCPTGRPLVKSATASGVDETCAP